MEDSNSYAALIEALSKAQGEFPEIPKTRKGQIGNRTFMYADLSDIHKLIKPVLAKNGLAVSHTVEHGEFCTRLFHKSGASVTAKVEFPKAEGLKETGATFTYLRRYNIQNVLDISTDEDLDAMVNEDGKGKGKPKEEKPPQEPPQKPEDSPPQNKPRSLANPISEKQRKRLFAIMANHGWNTEQLKEFLKVKYNLDSTSDINTTQYEAICTTVETKSYIQALQGGK